MVATLMAHHRSAVINPPIGEGTIAGRAGPEYRCHTPPKSGRLASTPSNNVRRAVLNALVWVSKLDVPEGGVQSKVTEEQLAQNLDPKPMPKPKSADAGSSKLMQRWASR